MQRDPSLRYQQGARIIIVILSNIG